MVSGFLTSPNDQDLIMSGEASPIRIETKCSVCTCCLKSLSRSFMSTPAVSVAIRSVLRFPNREGLLPLLLEFHVDPERTDLLHEHVERFGHAGIHLVVTVDDVLVHLRAAIHVVRLDR